MGFLSEFRNLGFLSPGILSLGILSVGILSAVFLSCRFFVANPIAGVLLPYRRWGTVFVLFRCWASPGEPVFVLYYCCVGIARRLVCCALAPGLCILVLLLFEK